MAHKKAGGSTTNIHDSPGQRLGIKRFAGQTVQSGNILVRQRGTRYQAGENVGVGVDHTLFAQKTGVILFHTKQTRRFTGKLGKKIFLSIKPTSL